MVNVKTLASAGVLAAYCFSNNAVATVSLGERLNYLVGEQPRSVAAIDINSDGSLDIVSALRSDTFAVSIVKNDGAGKFLSAEKAMPGTYSVAVKAADVNGNGVSELLVVDNIGSRLLIDDPIIPLSTIYSLDIGQGTREVVVGDFNGDGRIDIATANLGAGNVSVAMNMGSGFSTPVNYPVGVYPTSLAVGDFDKDGKEDIVVANSSSNTFSVLTSTGSSFVKVDYAIQSVYGVGVFDFDGDGDLDIVASNANQKSLMVYGNDNGVFSLVETVPLSIFPSYLAVGDIDGDGKKDVVVSGGGENKIVVLKRKGGGSWLASEYGTGVNPGGLALADVNKDGKLDVIVANVSDNTISVFSNTSVSEPSAPLFVSIVRSDSGATFSFNPPQSSGGAPISYYLLKCTSSAGSFEKSAPSSPVVVNGLNNGSDYSCLVTAINSGGESDPSNVLHVVPAGLPGAPSNVHAAAGDKTAILTFAPPVSDGGESIVDYVASCSPTGGGAVVSARAASSPLTVVGLVNRVSYQCSLRAHSAVGDGSAAVVDVLPYSKQDVADSFFDYAELQYPQYFFNASKSIRSQWLFSYYYRKYWDGSVLAVKDDRLYVVFPAFGNALLDLGGINELMNQLGIAQ